MKTIDLLVQALPAIGGWPEKVTHIGQDYDRELMFYGRGNVRTGIILDQLAVDHRIYGEVGVKITREQYEAALAAKNDGWIEWGGGECPVDSDAIVDVKLKGGVQIADGETSAAAYYWDHMNQRGDIIAYRPHQLQQAEQPDASEEDLNDCIGQAPATAWKEEWLPSAGCECEYQYKVHGSEWCSFECVAVDGNAAFGWSNNTPIALQLNTHNFRPIRSKAERRRDDAKYAIAELCRSSASNGHAADLIYDAIAAGEIPGVKLED